MTGVNSSVLPTPLVRAGSTLICIEKIAVNCSFVYIFSTYFLQAPKYHSPEQLQLAFHVYA